MVWTERLYGAIYKVSEEMIKIEEVQASTLGVFCVILWVAGAVSWFKGSNYILHLPCMFSIWLLVRSEVLYSLYLGSHGSFNKFTGIICAACLFLWDKLWCFSNKNEILTASKFLTFFNSWNIYTCDSTCILGTCHILTSNKA